MIPPDNLFLTDLCFISSTLAIGRGRVISRYALAQVKTKPGPERDTGSAEVSVEPGQSAFDYVAAVLGVGEHVAFVFVDYELGFDA